MKTDFPLDSLLVFLYYYNWLYGLYLNIYFIYVLEDRSLFCILRLTDQFTKSEKISQILNLHD